MKYKLLSVALATTLCAACQVLPDTGAYYPAPAEFVAVDPQATVLTANLLKNMTANAKAGKTMFGHQCSTLYGIGWYGDKNRSDIKSVCGDYPAVIGWDLAEIELGHSINIDEESFSDIREHILACFQRGGITTLSWHCTNPVTMNNAWDRTPAVDQIIPGAPKHAMFKGWLDKVADFISTLHTPNGTMVPVLFRPYHEHSGSGFWWGTGNCTKEQYVALWKFTVEYLRDVKGLHNIIYVYSPDIITSQEQYLDFWPGDDYVDILGIDAYEWTSWSLDVNGYRLMRLLNHISYLKNKPFAYTETGLENNTTQAKWWTKKLGAAISDLPVAYVLVWRNKNMSHFFGPYPGCVSENDFKDFISSDKMMTERDIKGIYE